MSRVVRCSIACSTVAAMVVLMPRAPLGAQAPRADDVPRHAADAERRRADAERRTGAGCSTRVSTPDWQAAERQTDIYLVSMTDGAAVDEADDVHDGEERDVAGVDARRQRVPVPVESRGAGERRDAEPDLPDASRRRRGAPSHRRQGRRRRFLAQPGRQDARLSRRTRTKPGSCYRLPRGRRSRPRRPSS